MSDDDPNRRELLRICAGLAATGGVAGLAGCGGSGDGTTTGDDGGDPTTTDSTPTQTATATTTEAGSIPDYAGWLYAPGIAREKNHYDFRQFDVARMRSNGSRLGEGYEQLKQVYTMALGRLGVGWKNAETLLTMGVETSGDGNLSSLVTGSFSASSVTDALGKVGFSEANSYEGYTILERSGSSDEGFFANTDTALVTDGELVWSAAGETATEVLKATVDTRAGRREGYASARSELGDVLATIGDGIRVRAGTHEPYQETITEASQTDPHFARQVASGRSVSVEDKTATVSIAIAYESEARAKVAPVSKWVANRQEASRGLFSRVEDTSVDSNERLVTIEATMPADRVFQSGGSGRIAR